MDVYAPLWWEASEQLLCICTMSAQDQHGKPTFFDGSGSGMGGPLNHHCAVQNPKIAGRSLAGWLCRPILSSAAWTRGAIIVLPMATRSSSHPLVVLARSELLKTNLRTERT